MNWEHRGHEREGRRGGRRGVETNVQHNKSNKKPGFYSGTKENEAVTFAGKWMSVETAMLSEISLPQKTTPHQLSPVEVVLKNKTT